MSSCGCAEGYNVGGAKKIKRWTEGKMKYTDLVDHAKKHKIPNYSKMNKAQLEAAVKAARAKK
jgi:hypothetical protein